MLHLYSQTYFGQFSGTSAHTLAAGSRAPEGIWTPRNTWLLLPWVCTENQLDRPSRLATIHSRPRQTQTDADESLTLG